jgi:hypothetical protein
LDDGAKAMVPAAARPEEQKKMIEVYVEKGQKRTFAAAIEWPGWCRSAKDEAGALQALLDYGPRYAKVLRGTSLHFTPPGKLPQLKVVERLKGGTTTDFGAPEVAPRADKAKLTAGELKRLEVILAACHRRLEAAAKAAKGKHLRTGPRGGGRNLATMLDHVREAEKGYTSSLGWKDPQLPRNATALAQVLEAALRGMRASAAGEIPAVGPRGGKRWSARYFVRRAAWHVLDHAWEIEDRAE